MLHTNFGEKRQKLAAGALLSRMKSAEFQLCLSGRGLMSVDIQKGSPQQARVRIWFVLSVGLLFSCCTKKSNKNY